SQHQRAVGDQQQCHVGRADHVEHLAERVVLLDEPGGDGGFPGCRSRAESNRDPYHATERVTYVTPASGALLALDAATGGLSWSRELLWHDHPVVGLPLASTVPGQLLIGTTDGRVLRARTT